MDDTLMEIAVTMSERGTCSRNRVGVVIAKDGRILGSGYNGAPSNMQHCFHADDEPLDAGCKIAIHAEANAIAYAARHGVSLAGATLYTTLSPCWPCAQLIIQAGILRVRADQAYRDVSGIDLLRAAFVEVNIGGN
jgi:dCMP deaminase